MLVVGPLWEKSREEKRTEEKTRNAKKREEKRGEERAQEEKGREDKKGQKTEKCQSLRATGCGLL